jgi:hypothetical protein
VLTWSFRTPKVRYFFRSDQIKHGIVEHSSCLVIRVLNVRCNAGDYKKGDRKMGSPDRGQTPRRTSGKLACYCQLRYCRIWGCKGKYATSTGTGRTALNTNLSRTLSEFANGLLSSPSNSVVDILQRSRTDDNHSPPSGIKGYEDMELCLHSSIILFGMVLYLLNLCLSITEATVFISYVSECWRWLRLRPRNVDFLLIDEIHNLGKWFGSLHNN